ncbi:MAG: bifunctional metallophosphatase/5'-nucleotidase [Lachnospiraceae bacterium]|nr:bifunctional metallophosphatase/5'-nucleotidase [Lachnospiraceae bacterium]
MNKKASRKAMSLLLALAFIFTTVLGTGFTAKAVDAIAENSIYRLYNTSSGEHFYTSNKAEYDSLSVGGWNGEGEAWSAPTGVYVGATPVYRLYNPNNGDHHYTTNAAERDNCVRLGWSDEGIGWYSATEMGEPVYRLYNPNAATGSHHYTKDAAEKDNLVTVGWKYEGIGWYGLSPIPAKENGKIAIFVTSDVHCGIEDNFGYAGLCEVVKSYADQGYETILVDDGDAIQGELIGSLSKGEAIIDIMNAVGYDVAIPGNHEFDYNMDTFLSNIKKTNFPYISCNFNKEGELVLEPYKIIEKAGKKIAFVGITTPDTFRSSTPKYFQNDKGEFIYGFCQDDAATGKDLYAAVQKAVDSARAEGADFVYVMGHMGNEDACKPYRYNDIIENTTGIDVFFDGHSHDTDKVVMKNKEGKSVTRLAVGTKLSCIGYSIITKDGKIEATDKYVWTEEKNATETYGLDNDITKLVKEKLAEHEKEMNVVVSHTDVDLTINDPTATDASGKPIRMVRRAETNLGDLVADAYKDQTGADVAIVNGGGVRKDIKKGDITYNSLLSVQPFGNTLVLIEVSGQQILDALEWGAHSVPAEFGGFLQVSGITYEIDTTVADPCTSDAQKMCTGISGERRVKNVKVGGEPIDPEKKYKLAGTNYTLLENGDGYTAFKDATVLLSDVKPNYQAVIDYVKNTLGGSIGEEYKELTGQGRIKILE